MAIFPSLIMKDRISETSIPENLQKLYNQQFISYLVFDLLSVLLF